MPGPIASASPSDLVPIPASLTKRLYGPIILQNTLNGTYDAMPGVVSTLNPDPSTDNDSQEFFPCFVNKLAQICDCKHGGDSVTAVAILQPGTIEYRLTSNMRTAEEYEDVKRYLTEDVLNVLQSIPEDGLDSTDIVQQTSERILVRVLAFNRWRIRAYVKLLIENVGFCITSCTNDNTVEGKLPIVSDRRSQNSLCGLFLTLSPATEVAAVLSSLQSEANEADQEWSNGIVSCKTPLPHAIKPPLSAVSLIPYKSVKRLTSSLPQSAISTTASNPSFAANPEMIGEVAPPVPSPPGASPDMQSAVSTRTGSRCAS